MVSPPGMESSTTGSAPTVGVPPAAPEKDTANMSGSSGHSGVRQVSPPRYTRPPHTPFTPYADILRDVQRAVQGLMRDVDPYSPDFFDLGGGLFDEYSFACGIVHYKST